MGVTGLTNRLVAFFDILGFSDRLEAMGIDEMHELYAGMIKHAQDKTFNPPTRPGSREPINVNFAVHKFVSDSIILVSEPLTENKFTTTFIGGAIHLMENFFTANLPLRGSIGFGDVLLDDEHDLMLSSTLCIRGLG